MKIVIDNNILFSLMKPDSTNSQLFRLLNFEFISPVFALHEFKKYEDECLKKSGLSKQEFIKRKDIVTNNIKFVKLEEYKSFLEEACAFSPDEDDSPYFVLCLKESCFLWSNDDKLKNQNKIKVLSTKDIIHLL